MRYFHGETASFTNADGRTYDIKLPLIIDTTDNAKKRIGIQYGDELDEIAQRKDIFGEGGEFMWWDIFQKNAVAIVENGFSLDGIKSLDIPALSQ